MPLLCAASIPALTLEFKKQYSSRAYSLFGIWPIFLRGLCWKKVDEILIPLVDSLVLSCIVHMRLIFYMESGWFICHVLNVIVHIKYFGNDSIVLDIVRG